jgi:tRNA (cmo5U34)-methyltransferase
MRDTIFTKNHDLVDFAFDDTVAGVFDDMVRRSVPGYSAMLEMIGLFVKTYAQDNSNFYDLGASTGAVSLALALNNPCKNTHIIAVDSAPAMVEKCQKNLETHIKNFEILCEDINQITFKNASIIVLNLTLQFIEPKQRQALIDKIYQGLNQNGILIVSEKIHTEDTKQQQITELHLNFKRANGYSELEIAAKRQSIENVLITDTESMHFARFSQAGFAQSLRYFQCLNFASFVAIK